MKRLLFLSTLFFYMACNNSSQEETTEVRAALTPDYFYYPKANVYFDSANNEYIFQGNDSLNWHSAPQIPAVVLAMMDKNVRIQNPSDPVWKDNEAHRLVYSAVLYATPSDTIVQKKVLKPTRQPEVTAVDSSAMEETKKRKGLGGFFDKIFGRKKSKQSSPQDSTEE